VDRAGIYVGTSSSGEDYQGYTATRSWAMPTGGLIAGDPVPTSSDLKPPLLWVLGGDLEITKRWANVWALQTIFELQMAA